MEILFENRADFRNWLEKNHQSSKGIWLILGKKEGPKTISADDALKEALCYGWIDGQIRKVDETTYIKYFAPRRKKSIWSKRNRDFTEKLIREDLMKEAGYQAIETAKKSGQWTPKLEEITEEHISEFTQLVQENQLALEHFSKMSKSIQKNYTGYFFSAKQEETKKKRLAQIIVRLERNLKPLDPL